jgi:hypothetical protein
MFGVEVDTSNKRHRQGLHTAKGDLDQAVKRGDVKDVEDWLQSMDDPFEYAKRLFP